MKRFLISAVIAVLACSCGAAPSSSKESAAVGEPHTDGPWFVRGDAHGDFRVNIVDAMHVIHQIFSGIDTECAKASDANDDGKVNISDPIYLLNFLFNSGAEPPAPFKENGELTCGIDPTEDELLCERQTCR